MAEKQTIARPYAQAIFELAQAQQALSTWSAMLLAAAELSQEPQIAELIRSPHVSKVEVADLFIAAGGDSFDTQGASLIKVLMENRRLDLLPEIAAQFDGLKAEAEGTITAEVTAAFELNSAQRKKLIASLSKKLGRDVELDCTVDTSLLGGVVVRAGDMVIDGSAAGKLTKLAADLNG